MGSKYKFFRKRGGEEGLGGGNSNICEEVWERMKFRTLLYVKGNYQTISSGSEKSDCILGRSLLYELKEKEL